MNSRIARQRDQDRPESSIWQVAQPKEDPLLPDMTAIDVPTPRSSRQVQDIHRELRIVDSVYSTATLRQVFRKAGKALDQATAQIASLRHERDQLAAALEQQKPKKRRKVEASAQERFVTMLDVRKVKGEMAVSQDAGGVVTAQNEAIRTDGGDDNNESEVEEVITVA